MPLNRLTVFSALTPHERSLLINRVLNFKWKSLGISGQSTGFNSINNQILGSMCFYFTKRLNQLE